MLSNLYKRTKEIFRLLNPKKISYKDFLRYLEETEQDTMNVYPDQVYPIRIKGEIHYVKLVHQKSDNTKQTKPQQS